MASPPTLRTEAADLDSDFRHSQTLLKTGALQNNATTFHDRNRKLQGVFASACDLTQLKQELEGFGYSVSHDLRAPLPHIHGYGLQVLLSGFWTVINEVPEGLRHSESGGS